MDYRQRQQRQQPANGKLTRGADGRLRPASDRSDIGDVWAQQSRIQLSDAIQKDRRQSEKKRKRSKEGHREFVLNFHLPKIRFPGTKTGKVFKSKKLLVSGLAALVLVAVLGSAYIMFANRSAGTDIESEVLTSDSLFGEEPEFRTVVPEGKSIDDLGGWARVSPPDRDPVFAFVDTFESVKLNVSQQQLPDSFKHNVDEEVANVAQQFNANERLHIGEFTVYVGTAISGVQSVIFVKDELLVLIRSASELTDEQWAVYVQSLQY